MITIENYLSINFSSELLEKMLNSKSTDKDLKVKLFQQ